MFSLCQSILYTMQPIIAILLSNFSGEDKEPIER